MFSSKVLYVCPLKKKLTCSNFKATLPEVHKFLSRYPTFWGRSFICAPDQARKKCVGKTKVYASYQDTPKTIAFCSLLTKQDLKYSF